MINTTTREEAKTDQRSGGVSLDLLKKQAIQADDPLLLFDAQFLKLLVMLPTAQQAAVKSELRNHFGRRLVAGDWNEAIKAAKNDLLKFQRHQGQDKRPTVLIDGQFDVNVDAAVQALLQFNAEKPVIFLQSGRLVTIHFDENKQPTVKPLTENSLRYHLARSAQYMTPRGDDWDNIEPPLSIVRAALDNEGQLINTFPPLVSVVELPIIRPDGSIHAVPGYDPVSKCFYIPGDLVIAPIPEKPTKEQVKTAREKLAGYFSDFPFADQASRANLLGDVITVVIRTVIEGETPGTLVNAPKQGTGKTLLAEAVGTIGSGRRPDTPTAPQAEEEWCKLLPALLRKSPSVVIIDNVTHPLDSEALFSAITTGATSPRGLSTNEILAVPNRAKFFVTGNNLRVSGDGARRFIRCDLDARMERPHTREAKQFKTRPGKKKYLQWILEERAAIVASVLTLARSWYAQGCPEPTVNPVGGFEDWTTIIGGILQAAEIPGFLANLNDETGNSTVDETAHVSKAFFQAVYDAFGETPFMAKQIAAKMLETTEQATMLKDTLPSQKLSESFDKYVRNNGDTNFPRHLGNVLSALKGQFYGNLCLETDGRDRTGLSLWKMIHQPEPASLKEIKARKLLKRFRDGESKGYKIRREGIGVVYQLPGSMPAEEKTHVEELVRELSSLLYDLLPPEVVLPAGAEFI